MSSLLDPPLASLTSFSGVSPRLPSSQLKRMNAKRREKLTSSSQKVDRAATFNENWESRKSLCIKHGITLVYTASEG